VNERGTEMLSCWLKIHDEIALIYGDDGPSWEQIVDYAPGIATRITDAEYTAERASMAWVDGGTEGWEDLVLRWRDLWLEATTMMKDLPEKELA